ncbi:MULTISPECIES: hypothetical protein [unclassified Anaerobiospirillum]|uniref:hypothetical protein n=1 Tax=unclassified Anaerobiospirillum TaxID=2647410 RepID=UPI001FF28F1F|nr:MULTISPECIES: hypothetical protein [unclassified Anaerobiospirillum]MCK0533668.1 hypothetical protein [Anaerobiospirillum sp. NML120511]MCK0539631.1 hypothetical protein [Anaerobiospirillum sp. NML02-A-032]
MAKVPIEYYKKRISKENLRGRFYNTKEVISGYYVFHYMPDVKPGAVTGLPIFLLCNSAVEEEPFFIQTDGTERLEYEIKKHLENQKNKSK